MFDWLRKDKWTEAKEQQLKKIKDEKLVLEEELSLEKRRRIVFDISLQLFIEGRERRSEDYV